MTYQISLRVLLLAAALSAERAAGNAFLGSLGKEGGLTASPSLLKNEALQRSILSELEDALGSEHRRATEARLGNLEEALRPVFNSLPKNTRGAVGAPAARYALHRLFARRHGWQMKGLEPKGEAWASASPVAALGDRVPGRVRDLFEDRLDGRGLNLHELAVLAATLENMVQAEADVRLRATFHAFNVSEKASNLSAERAEALIDGHMASYILGAEANSLTKQLVLEHSSSVSEQYPGWPETQAFLREVQNEVAPGVTSFDFARISSVIAEVSDRYGRWQGKECTALKKTLVGLEEHQGAGRVRLGDFYGSAMDGGAWQFSESVDYLRQLGALDDSDLSAMSVIIPNYILGPSNCVASSGYYAVCCIDECEELLGQIEEQIGAPTASADRIAKLVAALPSDSLPANRTLAPALRRRLDDVAKHHGGQVPLHGRLFAQWLHHAYPRECPYPHVSGTTNPLQAEAFEAETGSAVSASAEEMRQHVEASKGRRRRKAPADEEGLCSNMWTPEEELVDPEAHRISQSPEAFSSFAPAEEEGPTRGGYKAALRGLALAAAVASTTLGLARMLLPAVAVPPPKGAGSFTAPPPKVYAV